MQQKKGTYQSYYQTNVQTSDQLSLIIMLYDGVVRFLKKAIVKIEENQIEEAHNYLTRSKEIISELLATLKVEKGEPVGENLKELYVFCFKKIVEANLKKDAEIVKDVIRVMESLREGWMLSLIHI